MFLRFKHRKLLKEMNDITIEEKALKSYRFVVNGNIFEDDELLKKKLKRNFFIGEKINNRCVRYGNLYIYFKDNNITSIYNVKGKQIPLNINFKLKDELDSILGI